MQYDKHFVQEEYSIVLYYCAHYAFIETQLSRNLVY